MEEGCGNLGCFWAPLVGLILVLLDSGGEGGEFIFFCIMALVLSRMIEGGD
jgi:hypothetical protein